MIPGTKDRRDSLLFSLPFMTVFTLFLLIPLSFGVFISFFKWDILGTRKFIGLANYADLFRDHYFWEALWHTFQFVLMTTPTNLILGFLMALFITSKSPLKEAGEQIFFLPYVFSSTVIGTLWEWIFQVRFGILNQVIVALGGQEVGWLVDPRFAMLSVAVATVWWTVGFKMVLFSSGMKQISKEIYESADMDGVSYWKRVWYITIPLLKPTIILCLILQVISSFKVFGQVYVMTNGGPYGSTRVLVQYVYETGFRYFKMGYSAAMSMILLLIILAISILQSKILGGESDA